MCKYCKDLEKLRNADVKYYQDTVDACKRTIARQGRLLEKILRLWNSADYFVGPQELSLMVKIQAELERSVIQ